MEHKSQLEKLKNMAEKYPAMFGFLPLIPVTVETVFNAKTGEYTQSITPMKP